MVLQFIDGSWGTLPKANSERTPENRSFAAKKERHLPGPGLC